MKTEYRISIVKRIYYELAEVVNYLRYDVPQGFRNLVAYAAIIWRTREWDHAFLYDLMAFKLRRMERYHRDLGVTLHRERTARQLQITAYCLERISKDEYPGFREFCEMEHRAKYKFNTEKFKRDELMIQADLDRIAKEFKRHSRGWWD